MTVSYVFLLFMFNLYKLINLRFAILHFAIDYISIMKDFSFLFSFQFLFFDAGFLALLCIVAGIFLIGLDSFFFSAFLAAFLILGLGAAFTYAFLGLGLATSLFSIS